MFLRDYLYEWGLKLHDVLIWNRLLLHRSLMANTAIILVDNRSRCFQLGIFQHEDIVGAYGVVSLPLKSSWNELSWYLIHFRGLNQQWSSWTYFVSEIKWRLCINAAVTSSNFWHELHRNRHRIRALTTPWKLIWWTRQVQQNALRCEERVFPKLMVADTFVPLS